jgi:putative tryptophan/tyrosine transport system substrate-binding protein
MNKISSAILIGCLLLVGLLAGFIRIKKIRKQNTTSAYHIGILQTASHPALDAARDGFIQELQQLLHNDIEFIINNAQGSIPHAHTIAQQFHANKQLTGFFAIATPAAQALSAVEKERPIIIAAVTDPYGLGLIYPGTNVCGSQDMIDVKAAIELIRALVPTVKTVGLLYTSGEVNALAAAKVMRSELETMGITSLDFSVSQELDIAGLVESACRKVDVIFTPNDNIISLSISLIASIAQKNSIPLFVSDPMLVASGPLAARGINYTQSGALAARIAYEVLVDGKKPSDIPIEQTPSNAIVVNKKTVEALGLTIPNDLAPHVTLVG